MFEFDTCNTKISVPLLLALLIVAQVDLAGAFGWPGALLHLLHLTPAPDDICRDMCAGIGTAIDVIALYQLARIWARRALSASRDLGQG